MANNKSISVCADVREMNNINNKLTKAQQTNTGSRERVQMDAADLNINCAECAECIDCAGQQRVSEPAPTPALSDIQQFYHGKNILITGATGE